MDDEEMIRNIAATMLTHLGYQVTTCASGEETIDLYNAAMETGNPFVAVIWIGPFRAVWVAKKRRERSSLFFPRQTSSSQAAIQTTRSSPTTSSTVSVEPLPNHTA